MENTRGKFSDEVLSLVQCEVKPSRCIYNPPTKKEIEELCAEKGIESKYIPTVINIFNNIEGSSGGAAAEPSPSSKSSSPSSSSSPSLSTSVSSSDDSLSPSDYVSRSGYTQTQQLNYVDRVLLQLLLGGIGLGVTIGVVVISGAEKFLVSQGIMHPLCKGPLDRLAREFARQLEPSLAGPTCDERLNKAESILKWASGIITASYSQLTWNNWSELRLLLKDRFFEPMEVQKKITIKQRKKAKKEKTRKREKRQKQKKRQKKKDMSSRKKRSSKPPSPNGPSGSNPSLSKTKSRSRSKSRSKSHSRSKSQSRRRSRRSTTSK